MRDNRLAGWIEEQRRKKNLSVTDLARFGMCSTSKITKYLSGDIPPAYTTIRLFGAFDIEPEVALSMRLAAINRSVQTDHDYVLSTKHESHELI